MAVQTKSQITRQLKEAAQRMAEVNKAAKEQRASTLPDSGLDSRPVAGVTNTSLAGNRGDNRRD